MYVCDKIIFGFLLSLLSAGFVLTFEECSYSSKGPDLSACNIIKGDQACPDLDLQYPERGWPEVAEEFVVVPYDENDGTFARPRFHWRVPRESYFNIQGFELKFYSVEGGLTACVVYNLTGMSWESQHENTTFEYVHDNEGNFSTHLTSLPRPYPEYRGGTAVREVAMFAPNPKEEETARWRPEMIITDADVCHDPSVRVQFLSSPVFPLYTVHLDEKDVIGYERSVQVQNTNFTHPVMLHAWIQNVTYRAPDMRIQVQPKYDSSCTKGGGCQRYVLHESMCNSNGSILACGCTCVSTIASTFEITEEYCGQFLPQITTSISPTPGDPPSSPGVWYWILGLVGIAAVVIIAVFIVNRKRQQDRGELPATDDLTTGSSLGPRHTIANNASPSDVLDRADPHEGVMTDDFGHIIHNEDVMNNTRDDLLNNDVESDNPDLYSNAITVANFSGV